MLALLKMIKPTSLNKCFINWTQSLLPESLKDLTMSFDGKTICSTGKMDGYTEALHIVSAHIAELGLTIGQKAVDSKSNEIPAMRDLLELLDIQGCVIVADALHCQKKTAKAIIKGKGDYLLNVKDNQELLKKDIEDYVQDSGLRRSMDSDKTFEKSRGRIERRTAYTTNDIKWLPNKNEWKSLSCIGAINRRITDKKGTSNEWHYFISSRCLTAKELLKYARNEWSVETMHWLLDVHFGEDFCYIEDSDAQQNLNIVRKIALNSVRDYKNKTGIKHPLSKIMQDCLIDCDFILELLNLTVNHPMEYFP
jgi:predicted transposase YbfD/YdcC